MILMNGVTVRAKDMSRDFIVLTTFLHELWVYLNGIVLSDTEK